MLVEKAPSLQAPLAALAHSDTARSCPYCRLRQAKVALRRKPDGLLQWRQWLDVENRGRPSHKYSALTNKTAQKPPGERHVPPYLISTTLPSIRTPHTTAYPSAHAFTAIFIYRSALPHPKELGFLYGKVGGASCPCFSIAASLPRSTTVGSLQTNAQPHLGHSGTRHRQRLFFFSFLCFLTALF
jgi:hypothetical protein